MWEVLTGRLLHSPLITTKTQMHRKQEAVLKTVCPKIKMKDETGQQAAGSHRTKPTFQGHPKCPTQMVRWFCWSCANLFPYTLQNNKDKTMLTESPISSNTQQAATWRHRKSTGPGVCRGEFWSLLCKLQRIPKTGISVSLSLCIPLRYMRLSIL